MELYDRFIKSKWRPNWFAHPPPSETLLEMVIVEPRCHEYLPYVLANASHMLPYAALTVVHSGANGDYIKAYLPSNTNIRFLNVLPNNLSLAEYSALLMSTRFWEMLVSPKVLVFQTDTGILCNNILEFLHLDFVGAPWKTNWGEEGGSRCHVGNGGFSLRDRKAMIEMCEEAEGADPFFGPEDIFFARRLANNGTYTVATIPEALRFSVETVMCEKPFGFHKPWEAHPRWYIEDLFKIDTRTDGELNRIESIEIRCGGIGWHGDCENGVLLEMDERSMTTLQRWVSLGIGPRGLHVSKRAMCPIKSVWYGRRVCVLVGLSSGETKRIYFD